LTNVPLLVQLPPTSKAVLVVADGAVRVVPLPIVTLPTTLTALLPERFNEPLVSVRFPSTVKGSVPIVNVSGVAWVSSMTRL